MTTRRTTLKGLIAGGTLALALGTASAQTVTLRSADTHPDG